MSVTRSGIDGRRCPSVARPPPPTRPTEPFHVPSPARPARCRPRSLHRVLLPTVRYHPGQAAARLRELRHLRAPAQARPARGQGRRGDAHGPPGRRGRGQRPGRRRGRSLRRRRACDPGRGQHHLLLRRPGQGLGHRPRQRAVGGLHRDRRRTRRPRRPHGPQALPGRRRRHLLHHRPRHRHELPTDAHRYRLLLRTARSVGPGGLPLCRGSKGKRQVVPVPLGDPPVPGADGAWPVAPPYPSPRWWPRPPIMGRVLVTLSVTRAVRSAVIESACACVSRPAFTAAAIRVFSAATSLSTSVAWLMFLPWATCASVFPLSRAVRSSSRVTPMTLAAVSRSRPPRPPCRPKPPFGKAPSTVVATLSACAWVSVPSFTRPARAFLIAVTRLPTA